jgi:hypothetical protein
MRRFFGQVLLLNIWTFSMPSQLGVFFILKGEEAKTPWTLGSLIKS